MSLRNHLPLFVVLLSVLGILVCAGGVVAVWSLGSRLSRTTVFVFEGVDQSLTAAGDRVLLAQQLAQQWKFTAEDLQQALRERAQEKTAELVQSRLNIQKSAERLGEGLQQADAWLGMSTAAIQGVGQSLEILRSLGAPAPGDLVETLLEQLNGLRNQVQDAAETVSEISRRAADMAEGPSAVERQGQLVQFAARLSVTLGDVDSHLAELAERISGMQSLAEELQPRTQHKIAAVKFGLIALLIWLAIGQVSLCIHGWRNYRRNQPAA